MSTNKMWGGRFQSGPADIMREITPSIDFDKRLAAEDIAGSRAHCRMRASESIIAKDDGLKILDGLTAIEKELAEGKFVRLGGDVEHGNSNKPSRRIAGCCMWR